MKRLLVAACIGFVALAGCNGEGSPINPPPSSGATAAPPVTSAPAAADPTSGTTSSALVLAPGRAGPFLIGMTSEQAIEDGLVGEGDCGLTAIGTYQGFSVQFADSAGDDLLSGVLVKSKGAKTAEGIGVGDSIAKLKEMYGAKLKRSTGEYGETRYVLTEGNDAIGFTEGDGDSSGEIFAIDVFPADSPVTWDGC